MIKLNPKTQQDFLNREWVQRLLDDGVDMGDAKYYICTHLESTGLKGNYIYYAEETKDNGYILSCIPTYTVSELLYKLREKQGIYTIFNNLRNNDIDNTPIIESLASLLIQCHKKDIGIKIKDTGDISNK